MNRPTAKYLFLLALATVLFYWKICLTEQFTLVIGSEGVNQSYAWLHFWVNSLRHGHVPLWDPYVFCGRPFSGEMLPSAFYPLNLIFVLLPLGTNGLISQRYFDLWLVMAHLLCAYFGFALLRELRRSRFAAFVGACCFALSGVMVSVLWPPYVEAAMWLPAIFLFLLRAFRAGRSSRAVLEASLGGLCLGLSILTGGLHMSMLQGILAVTAGLYYGAAYPPAGPSRRAHWLRIGLILGTLVAVAGAVGAVQLLPASEYSQWSVRFIEGGTFPASERIPLHRMDRGMWPQSILTLLFPTGFGGKVGGGETRPFYIGVFPLLLAITAIWKYWSNLWVRYLAGLAVLAFAYSLAEFSPLYGVLYAVVPYLWVVRESSRFLYLVSFAMSVLAAFGLDALLDAVHANASWTPARRILKWIAIACAAALFVPGVFGQIALNIWICLSLLLILASCGWFAYFLTHPAGTWARVLAAAFILFDLSAFHWLPVSRAELSKSGDQLDQMVTLRGVAEFLKSRPEPHRVRVAVAPEPNIGDVYGVESVWGGGATVLADYERMLKHEELLNVRYIVKPASAADPAPVYQDWRWKVYENPNAYPRAWLVHQAVIEKSPKAAFRRLDDPAVNLHDVAVLDTPLPRGLEEAAGTAESLRFRSYEPDRMSIDVTAGGAGMLVLSELWYPGWRAQVNGQAARIWRVDGGLRGVPLPRGQSRVVLEYVPLGVYAGGAVSLATFLGVLAAWALSRRRKNRFASGTGLTYEPGAVDSMTRS